MRPGGKSRVVGSALALQAGQRTLAAWPPLGPEAPATADCQPMRRPTVSPEDLAYYRAYLREAVREDGVVCLECGAVPQFLAPHVGKHGLTIADDRECWGYNRGTALVTAAIRAGLRERARAQGLAAHRPPDSPPKAVEASQRLRPPPRREGRLHHGAAARAPLAAGALRVGQKTVPDDTLRALAAQGLAAREVAARTGMAPRRVQRRLRALAVVGSSRPQVTTAEFLALRTAGLWLSEIAARTGLTVNAVHKRLGRLQRRAVPDPPAEGPPPRPGRRVSDDRFLAFVRKGLRPAEIAARAGITRRNVQKRLASLRRRGPLPPSPVLAASREEVPRVLRSWLPRSPNPVPGCSAMPGTSILAISRTSAQRSSRSQSSITAWECSISPESGSTWSRISRANARSCRPIPPQDGLTALPADLSRNACNRAGSTPPPGCHLRSRRSKRALSAEGVSPVQAPHPVRTLSRNLAAGPDPRGAQARLHAEDDPLHGAPSAGALPGPGGGRPGHSGLTGGGRVFPRARPHPRQATSW